MLICASQELFERIDIVILTFRETSKFRNFLLIKKPHFIGLSEILLCNKEHTLTRTKSKTKTHYFFLTERIVYFLNTVQRYNNLKVYCYYEIQIHT
jgi:hypothetical protein